MRELASDLALWAHRSEKTADSHASASNSHPFARILPEKRLFVAFDLRWGSTPPKRCVCLCSNSFLSFMLDRDTIASSHVGMYFYGQRGKSILAGVEV